MVKYNWIFTNSDSSTTTDTSTTHFTKNISSTDIKKCVHYAKHLEELLFSYLYENESNMADQTLLESMHI